MKKSKNALYNVIKVEILNYIKDNELKPHALLPSEAEFSAKYHVSKMTVKLALNALTSEDIIYRIPRSGSFVGEGAAMLYNRAAAELPTSTIALVVPPIDLYVADIIDSIQEEAANKGYNVIIKVSKDALHEERHLSELSSNKSLCGIILYPYDRKHASNILMQLRLNEYPIVLIDSVFNDLSIDSVCHNHYQGAYDITSYLISMGHKNIGFITLSDQTNQSRRERYRAYLDALVDNEIYIDKNRILQFEDYTIDNMPGLDTYLAQNTNLTAVFCVNDVIATSFTLQLIKRRVSVPEDISVVGFTDSKILSYLPINLTTVRQPIKSLSTESVKILINRIQSKSMQIQNVKIPTVITERDSVKKLI